MVADKIKQYQGSLHEAPPAEQVKLQIEKQAVDIMDRIISKYSHGTLRFLAQIMKKTFVSIYEKIVINEQSLAKLRKLSETRKGPILFCPTHRSYIDFLLVSLVLYYYKMEVPFICAGEDFL